MPFLFEGCAVRFCEFSTGRDFKLRCLYTDNEAK